MDEQSAADTSVSADELLQELRALRAEVADLRRQVAQQERSTAPPATMPSMTTSAAEVDSSEPGTSRRSLLRTGLTAIGAAAGATAAVGALPGRAAAVAITPSQGDGEAIVTGGVNIAEGTTELRFKGFPNTPPSIRNHVFVVQDGAWDTPNSPPANSAPGGYSAAIAAYTGAIVMHGGYFQSNTSVDGSAGVRTRGESNNAYGLSVAGRRAAIFLEATGGAIAPPDRKSVTVGHVVGEIDVDIAGDLWYCIAPGKPGTWRKLSGPATAGQFHAITPARVYDSRYTLAVDAGVEKIQPSQARTISVANAYVPDTPDQSITNVVPAGATAIAYNLTVVNTGPNGFLSVNPGGTPAITAASINWSAAGLVLGNAAIVGLDQNRQIVVFCSTSSTDFVIDVTGYFR